MVQYEKEVKGGGRVDYEAQLKDWIEKYISDGDQCYRESDPLEALKYYAAALEACGGTCDTDPSTLRLCLERYLIGELGILLRYCSQLNDELQQ